MTFRRLFLLVSLLLITTVAAGCVYSKDEPPIEPPPPRPGPNIIPPPICIPTPCSATGKNCGEIDNSCEKGKKISCGTCTAPATCGGGGVANVCAVKDEPCTEADADFCKRYEKTCGSHSATDNCGKAKTATCGPACSPSCVPTPCSATGKNCGEIDNSCEKGKKISCGTCTAPATCGGGGVVNVCAVKEAPCTETDADFCKRYGKTCGSYTDKDKCGNSKTVTCGPTCPVVDATPPAVKSIDPLNGASDIEPSKTTIKVVFTETINPDSLKMTLSRGDGVPVKGTRVFDASKPTETTFSVDDPKLALLTKYTVKIEKGLKDKAIPPNELAADFSSSFTTRDGKWRDTASPVSDPKAGSLSSTNPGIAMNGEGTVVMVWRGEAPAGLYKIYGRVSGTAPFVVRESGGNRVQMQKVGIDGSGQVVFVWREYDGTTSTYQIKARAYAAGGTVTDAVLGSGTTPAVAVDGSGKTMVVWVETSGGVSSITASYSGDTGKKWNRYPRVDEIYDDFNPSVSPQVAADGKGGFLVAWIHLIEAGRYNVYSRFFNSTTSTWSDLSRVNSLNSADTPQVASDGAGNFVVVWQQTDGTTSSIYARKMKGSTPEGDPVKVSKELTGNSSKPHVAMNRVGEAIAIWDQAIGPDVNVYTSRLGKSGWSTPLKLNSATVPTTQESQVVLDDSGNAIAIWKGCEITTDGEFLCIRAARISAADPTKPKTEKIDSPSDLGSGNPRLAIDSQGRIVAVWEQAKTAGTDTKYHVYWRSFD